MTATLAQLITSQDQPTILANMYATAAALGVDVVGVQAERLFRALYEIEATAKANEQVFRVGVAKGAFLDTAADVSPYASVLLGRTTWLDLLAAGYYGLTRAPATSTIGVVRFAASALAVAGSIQAGKVTVADAAGNLYQNIDAFTITPSASVNVRVRALVAGSVGNVANNTIATMSTTIGGVTVDNPPQIGSSSWITTSGTDPERNAPLITRCRARWGATAYGGSAGAYAQWISDAFTTAGATSTITRHSVDDTNPNGPGSTDIYLANGSGPATAAELTQVDDFLQPRRGLGRGPLRTIAAPAFTLPLSIVVYGSADTAAATNAVNEVFSETQLGGTIFIDALTAALLALPGVYNAPVAGYASGAIVKVPVGQVPVANLSLSMVA